MLALKHNIFMFVPFISAMSNNALVTGACGFTGSHMVERLSKSGWNVTATDLEGASRDEYYTTSENRLSPVYYSDFYEGLENVEFIPADITEENSLEKVFDGNDFDVVFHIASLFDYFADWEILEEVNVEGVQNVLDFSSMNGVDHFVHWSTLGVLGEAGFETPKTEEDDYSPHNDYCKSKMMQEKYVKSFIGDVETTIIRPAPLYGPRHKYGVLHVLKTLETVGFAPIFNIKPEKYKLVFPSTHVDDIVSSAIYLHKNKEKYGGEIYNVLSDNITQDELLRFLADEMELRKIEIPMRIKPYKCLAKGVVPLSRVIEKLEEKRGSRPPVDAAMTYYLSHNMWFSNEKIKDTGFKFNYQNPKKGLREYVEWARGEGLIK